MPEHDSYPQKETLLQVSEGNEQVFSKLFICRVHRRAYGKSRKAPDVIDIKAADVPTFNAFIARALQERAYDNIIDGKHWLDPKRPGNS